MSYVRIQLVEDDATAVELVKEALSDAVEVPYHVKVHSDGEAALNDLRLNPDKPHLILLDLNLPRKSGLDVLQTLKSDPTLMMIPTIILTNSKSQEDVVKAYGNHCNAYIQKPLEFGKLVDSIKAVSDFWFNTATLPNGPQVLRK